MAHPLFHFGVGLAIGTVALLPAAVRKIRSDEKIAPWLAKRTMAACAIGAFAVVPGVLHFIGVPRSICDGWWMNLFVFHHILNKLKPGGLLVGEALAVLCFVLQYLLLLVALRTRLKLRAQSP